MADEVFRDREMVKKQMDLPGEVSYSFIGVSTPEYHARLEQIVVRTVGEENVRHRSFRASGGGNYTAYRYELFHLAFEEVEQLYRDVMALPGTKFVL